jgi:DNA-binding CsgD family transcriptional regulator
MTNDTQDWYGQLTAKEREVLEAYAVRHSYDAVAKALGKSESVVDRQLMSARRKMGVTSTAEAMFLLAARKAQLEGPTVAAYAENINPKGERETVPFPAAQSRKAHYIIWAVAVCGILVAVGATLKDVVRSHASGTRTAGNDADLKSLTPDALKTRIEQLRRAPASSRGAAMESVLSAQSVVELCDRAWEAKWGPSEDYIVSTLTAVAPDVRAAFEWALVHDPDMAIHIIGNGHRLFSRIPALHDWSDMLDRALSNEVKHGVEYGRALCGVAFAHWRDDNPRALKAAESAVALFARLPNSELDEANALRHEGFCLAAVSTISALKLDRQVLAIYQRLGDTRGVAQAELTLGQAGGLSGAGIDPVAADRVGWCLKAAGEFRKLRNRNCYNECIAEIQRNEGSIPHQSAWIRLRRSMRDELTLAAQGQAQARMIHEEMELEVHSLKIDCELDDSAHVADDIESLLTNRTTIRINRVAADQLIDYYRWLCRKLRRTVHRDFWDPRPGDAAGRGAKLTARDVVAAAIRLTSPVEPW